ncbi:MAG: hypothetical protein KIT02_10375 [Devosia sp.]|uniref:hypothetical protein n=1 Tax=Devosia sp. TaxID=1871048 RepID=UPI0024CA39B2|nr:hypothetical protein [Devosia sp.]UYN98371.1 MAG: hypothetical protein KIT02_10375 [Devosia sp.]
MKFEIKQWLPLLAVVPIIWLGLYLWAWMGRVGCGEVALGECWVTALGNWGADVVMLRWVDTTLGAGILAVVAASAIFLNSAIDRKVKRLEAEQLRQHMIDENVATLLARFRQTSLYVLAADNPEATIDKLQDIMAENMKFWSLRPNIASTLDHMVGLAVLHARHWKAETDSSTRKLSMKTTCSAICEIAFTRLCDPEKVKIDDIDYKLNADTELLNRIGWEDLAKRQKEFLLKYLDRVEL